MGLELPSPFCGINIKVEKTIKLSLETEVIKRISRLELTTDCPECLARDVFMFSFYTRGMAFVDIALLKKTDIIPGEIRYKRQKAGQLIRIGINRQISQIMEKYENTEGDYLFPLLEKEKSPYEGYKDVYHRIRYSLKKYPKP